METRKIRISAIHCQNCTNTISNELMDLPGVESVLADPESKNVEIKWDTPATWEQITATLDEIGFPADH